MTEPENKVQGHGMDVESTGVRALIDDVWQIYKTTRGAQHVWRFVISPAALEVLRRQRVIIDEVSPAVGELRLFGLPVRFDEHAERPMLEINRETGE